LLQNYSWVNLKINGRIFYSFFAESSQDDEKSFSEADRLYQLSKRKAYLELALAKTLKELKDL